MPKYKNSSATHLQIIGKNGNTETLAPGREIETYLYYTLPGLAQVSDLPRYNPLISSEEITSDGEADDQEIVISTITNRIEIINKTESDISVFWGAVTNTPATVVPAGTLRIFSDIKGLVDKLIAKFPVAITGGFWVIQAR